MPDETPRPLGSDETVARDPSSSPKPGERFSPGDVLAERYRIIALLGRGGMGEVYRADDLKLGQQVALKFLPRDVLHHPSAIEKLYGEVRLGRKVSHPNVCRLYDVGEWRGNHFVTMEYIDGEDLASLLRRIGQLPQGKAVELAQDICAGIAAAHGLGVVHRDLKPANIMIDGRGNAVITDFGLAALAEDLEGRTEFAGTPAYMAPEQLGGGTATHKSDLYSLGLILYEMFTGRRRFDGRSVEEIRRFHESADLSTTSRDTKSIDPVVQQVILRCLERDPEERPRSIHSVIAALPGADPLQAAIDAGETPSPEMVAAAGKRGELALWKAAALLATALVLLVTTVWLKQKTELYGVRPLPNHPRVLENRAQEILELVGLDAPARDTSYYLGLDVDYVLAPRSERQRYDPASALPSPFVFYYRQSPELLLPLRGHVGDRRILPTDPPLTLPGMALVTLTPEGHLNGLLTIPAGPLPAAGDEEPPWHLLLERAGLDVSSATEVAPTVPAPVDTDQRRSWEARYPDQPEQTVRVDAAALGGRIVWFDVAPPWRQGPLGDRQSQVQFLSSPPEVVVTIIVITALVFGFWFARRNLRRGRGDRSGAYRLGLAILLAFSVSYLLRADLGGPLPYVWGIATERIGMALFRALVIVILYLAIEPYLRRGWPTLLVSWSRTLAGRWRDPLVGRHVLIGAVAGIISSTLELLARVIGPEATIVPGAAQSTLTSARQAMAMSISGLTSGLLPAFVLTTIMVGIAALFHRRLAGALSVWLLMSTIPILGAVATDSLSVSTVVTVLLNAALVVTVLYKLGLLAGFVLFGVTNLMAYPLTLDTDAFYFPSAMIALAFILGLLAWGFFASLESRPHHAASLRSAESL